MLSSLALVILVGLAMAAIAENLKLPRIIGMLLTGVVLGPYVLDLFAPELLAISGELRKIALIIILVKAGLTLNLSDLKKVGRPAVLMAFLPATFEIIAYALLAPAILGITGTDALVMGAVLSAVSPAVVVPRMVSLIENRYGTRQGIPQMILAGASCDDIFVIVLFSTFVDMAQGGAANWAAIANVPVSMVLGCLGGLGAGLVLSRIFTARQHKNPIRSTVKVILLLGVAFGLMSVEDLLETVVPFSGLLSVVAMACTMKVKLEPGVTGKLSGKIGKLWLGAEIVLFVLVGAAVDIRYTLRAGMSALLMIFLALGIRAIGVWLCMLGTRITWKERIFCVISYLPKATVQAAIGSVPLALGLPCGPMVLSVAVLGILVTAPLGAIGIDATYKKLLTWDEATE